MTYSSDWLSIANRALLKTGNQQIESFNAGSENVNFIKTLLPEAVESVLALYPWKSLTRRVELSPSTITPAWGYRYQYPLPNDIARLNSVDTASKWEREAGMILTDSAYCKVTYVEMPENATDIAPSVKELIVLRLAYNLVQVSTSNTTLMNLLLSEFSSMLTLAETEEHQGEPDNKTFKGWAENR